jgi:hypothetical protein
MSADISHGMVRQDSQELQARMSSRRIASLNLEVVPGTSTVQRWLQVCACMSYSGWMFQL